MVKTHARVNFSQCQSETISLLRGVGVLGGGELTENIHVRMQARIQRKVGIGIFKIE